MITFLFLGAVVTLLGALVFSKFITPAFLKSETAENNRSEIAGIIIFIIGIILMLVFLIPLLTPQFASRGM